MTEKEIKQLEKQIGKKQLAKRALKAMRQLFPEYKQKGDTINWRAAAAYAQAHEAELQARQKVNAPQ